MLAKTVTLALVRRPARSLGHFWGIQSRDIMEVVSNVYFHSGRARLRGEC